MPTRIATEVALVGDCWGPVVIGSDPEHVLFTEYPFPEGWNRECGELLVIVPPGYPVTPPDNFYVEPGLQLAVGGSPGFYSEGPHFIGRQWAQFSIHGNETWRSSPDPAGGHNLATFMLIVRDRLEAAD